MREYNAYLFDADGTLIDTRELIYRSFVHAGEVMRTAMPPREAVEATTGLPVVRQIRHVLGWDKDEVFYEQAIQAYTDFMLREYPAFLKLFPGTAEGLEHLAGRGKKLAVVTSRRRRTLELFLDVTGITDYFAALITPEDTGKHKPDPDPALLALRLLDANPGEAVFVGDAEFDIRCGKSAGTSAAFVTWGGMEHSQWDVQPDFVARVFADLLPE